MDDQDRHDHRSYDTFSTSISSASSESTHLFRTIVRDERGLHLKVHEVDQ